MSTTINYILLQCFFWCLYAFPWSFTALYLSHCGIGSTQTGLITGISSILSIILQPYISSVIIKYKYINFKTVLAFSACIFIAFGFIMLFKQTPHITIVSFLIICTLSASVPSVISTVCMEYINSGIPVNFGLARGLGSISYAMLVFALGKAVNIFSADILVPVYIFFSIVFFAVVLIMKMPESNFAETDKHLRTLDFVNKNKSFIVFLVASVLLFMSHFMINSFLINKITAVGGNSFNLGVSLFISAGIELPVMSCIVILINKIGIKTLMTLCSVFFVIKTAVLLFADSITAVYISQFLQFGAFAVYTPASVYFVNMTLEEKYKPTGQALVGAATLGIGSAFGNIIGGVVLDAQGINLMLVFALIFSAIGCIIMITQRISTYKRNLLERYFFKRFILKRFRPHIHF